LKYNFFKFIVSLILAASLFGCDANSFTLDSDATNQTNSATGAANNLNSREADQPSIGGSNINFGVAFPSDGLRVSASLDSVETVQSLVRAFQIFNANQPRFIDLQTNLIVDVQELMETLIRSGVCDGKQVVVSSVIEETGAFVSRSNFNQFCNDDELLNTHPEQNGVVTVNGSGPDFDRYTMRFFNYSFDAINQFKITIGGEVYVDTSINASMNLRNVVIDLSTDQIRPILFSDFKTTEFENGTIYTGDIFHPDIGKVLVTTQTRVNTNRIEDDFDSKPSSGVLELVGLNSTARISFIDPSVYRVQIDVNDDLNAGGIYDIEETVSW
jgi:hypothetical protein